MTVSPAWPPNSNSPLGARAAAMRTCGRFADPGALRLVVRGSGMDDDTLGRAVGAPVLHRMGDQRGLAEAIDVGLGPVRSRRGPLGRVASSVLAALAHRAASRAA